MRCRVDVYVCLLLLRRLMLRPLLLLRLQRLCLSGDDAVDGQRLWCRGRCRRTCLCRGWELEVEGHLP